MSQKLSSKISNRKSKKNRQIKHLTDRLSDSQVNENSLTDDFWEILEPAFCEVVGRMIRRESRPYKNHSDQNQLIENVCDRIRDFLTSEIVGFETKSNQATETNGRHRRLKVRTKKPSKRAQTFAKSLSKIMSRLGMTVDQFAKAANIDRNLLQAAMNTGEIDFYDYMKVRSFLISQERNESLIPLVESLHCNFDTMCPSMTLLGGPRC